MSAASEISQKTMLIAGASLASAAFIGYCVYFDHKRRTDPKYKEKIRERRRLARQNQTSSKSGKVARMPVPTNPTEAQAMFMQEVQLGEEMLGEGDIELGTDHLANAVTLSGQPRQLVQVFQQTLPEMVFELLIHKLPAKQKQLQAALLASQGVRLGTAEGDTALGNDHGPTITEHNDFEEDDLE